MSDLYEYRTIVVGTDGSDLSGPTVARAAWTAAHGDADLVIVCAYAELSRRQEARNVATIGGDTRVGQVLGRSAASAALMDATAIAREHKATVTAALMVDGEPGQALLKAADDHNADLIVIGAMQDHSIADRILGSVATEVVRQAPCEVLIVRPRGGAPRD